MIGALLLTVSGTACAQSFSAEFSIAYESALLDSAALYEALKPTHQSLEYAYSQRGKEVEALRNALRMSQLQSELQKQEHDRQREAWERKQRRARNWNRLKTLGLVAGGTLMLLK